MLSRFGLDGLSVNFAESVLTAEPGVELIEAVGVCLPAAIFASRLARS